jgi:hypothetical protein
MKNLFPDFETKKPKEILIYDVMKKLFFVKQIYEEDTFFLTYFFVKKSRFFPLLADKHCQKYEIEPKIMNKNESSSSLK